MEEFKQKLKVKHTMLKDNCINDVWYRMSAGRRLSRHQINTLNNYNNFLDNLSGPERNFLMDDIKEYGNWIYNRRSFLIEINTFNHRSKVYNFK